MNPAAGALVSLSLQVNESSRSLPRMQRSIQNITARLEPHRYLHHRGLYSSLALPQLVQELTGLETHVGSIHAQLKNQRTQKLSEEVKPCLIQIQRAAQVVLGALKRTFVLLY